MPQATRSATFEWVQIGTGITGRFFVQNRPGPLVTSAVIQATNGTAAPTSEDGAAYLRWGVALEGESLATSFGVPGANTVWVRGLDGQVNISASWV